MKKLLISAAIICMMLASGCSTVSMPSVSYTAYTSLYWLREAGVPEAAEFSDAIGNDKVNLSKDTVAS